jgi:hypothetical protein
MNRRAAIAALVALPAATKISVAQITTRDVIVFECPGPISNDAAERIKACAKMVWPDTKCVVLGDGMTLKVLSTAGAEIPWK